MDKSSWVFLGLLALLVACAGIAGCSGSSSSPGTAGTTTVTTPAASSAAPLYAAGDIIKNPKSSGAAVLIIGYDPGTDEYERAYIYPNSDGSWGHRIDTTTAKVGRSTIEKVYTAKVSTMAVSAVPIGAPTTAATRAPTAATTTTAVTTTATATTAPAPKVTDITPGKGATGTTVSITELDGQNFQTGATVSLIKTGEPDIPATNVNVKSAGTITCTFAIPSGTTTGFWDILVKNPDGQAHQYHNGFDILPGTATPTTTGTGTTTTASNVTIITLSPTAITTGGTATPGVQVTVIGTNLGSASNLILTNGATTITGTGYYATSNQQARTMFDIPAGSVGTWTISAVDSSGKVLGSLVNGLTIQ